MGVPRLDRFFRLKYKKHIYYFNPTKNYNHQHVDILCLDSNPLIHKACQIVFNYGQYQRMLNPFTKWTYERKVNRVYELFFIWVKELIDMVSLDKVLYIAIDGVAPLAKQIQQRQRRFVKKCDEGFDSNCISAGTFFMHGLMQYINAQIRECKKNVWKNLEVVFSSHTCFGEGEHKIMDYIKTRPLTDKVCMFGPDGDLLMLGLVCEHQFFLLKENLYADEQYYIIDMTAIKKELVQTISVDDFVFLGFFLGNDFLPKIQMFHLLEDGLKSFLHTIRLLKLKIIENKELNKNNFKTFIEVMQRKENDYIASQKKIIYPNIKFVNNLLNSCFVQHKKNDSVVDIFNFSKYRKLYYYEKMNITTSPQIKNVVFNFLDGMWWIYKYYTQGCPSVDWVYKYHYPPFLIDVLQYFDEWEMPVFKKTTPHLPFEQLLGVLPPHSFNLLPPIYKLLLEDEDIKEFYKCDDLVIDYEGKTQDYQGIVLTPLLDFKLIRKKYQSIKLNNVYERNIPSQDNYF